jgi:predicted Fe-Mo cluster-binding NifX family protein
MKVAVVVNKDHISEHFGQSSQIDLYDINNQDIRLVHKIEMPEHQHKGVPIIISNLGVDLVICGNLGEKAKDLFIDQDIKVISGASGKVADVLNAFMNQTLVSKEELCKGHNHHHGHHDEEKEK